jgi:hypothetical protein
LPKAAVAATTLHRGFLKIERFLISAGGAPGTEVIPPQFLEPLFGGAGEAGSRV